MCSPERGEEGKIPEITISGVLRDRLTGCPVQTTQSCTQELSLNFSATGRHTWWGGVKDIGYKCGNGGMASNAEGQVQGARPRH